ncbi:hypothetical protein PYCC9005_002413 [Savitreella phatthalungensis]
MISWGWVIFSITICLQRIGGITGFLLFSISSILCFMVTWSYFTASLTPPGSPSGRVAHADDGKLSLLPQHSMRSAAETLRAVTRKSDGGKRYCSKCDYTKPDRAHHCRACGQCVLKMDHHCPWLATCLGYRNYKAFVLFLLYTAIWCLYMTCAAGLFLWTFFESTNPEDIDATLLPINWIVLFVLAAVITIVVGLFGSWHLYLLLRNYTTIEYMEETRFVGDQHMYRSKRKDGRPPPKLINIFDLGARQNWTQVMGDRPLGWLVPTPSVRGDGKHFDISAVAQKRLEERRNAEERHTEGHRDLHGYVESDFRESFDSANGRQNMSSDDASGEDDLEAARLT